jgi:hypothetical protein
VVSSDEEGNGEPVRPEAANVGELGSESLRMLIQPLDRGRWWCRDYYLPFGCTSLPRQVGPSVPPANIRARGTAVQEDTPRPSSPFMQRVGTLLLRLTSLVHHLPLLRIWGVLK